MAQPKQLLTPKEAADIIGVSVTTVKEWMRRADSPLPSVQVGKSGRVHRVVSDQIDTWLVAEASRKAAAAK
jgi:excisionase family DNA binding protein